MKSIRKKACLIILLSLITIHVNAQDHQDWSQKTTFDKAGENRGTPQEKIKKGRLRATKGDLDSQEMETIVNRAIKKERVESKSNLLQSMENTITVVDVILGLIAAILTVSGVIITLVFKRMQKKLNDYDKRIKKARKVLNQAKGHLTKLDEIDLLTKTKISAIQKTLIQCLENAPNRDIAFATYSKLLAAYEILLNNSHEKITAKMQQEMEIKATIIQGNKKYVPEETLRFMIENMNLPYEVRGILWGAR